jgi:hypothetical protein
VQCVKALPPEVALTPKAPGHCPAGCPGKPTAPGIPPPPILGRWQRTSVFGGEFATLQHRLTDSSSGLVVAAADEVGGGGP